MTLLTLKKIKLKCHFQQKKLKQFKWSKITKRKMTKKRFITKISSTFDFFGQKSPPKKSCFSWCFHMGSPRTQNAPIQIQNSRCHLFRTEQGVDC